MRRYTKAAFAELEARMEGGKFDTELMIQCSDAGSTVVEMGNMKRRAEVGPCGYDKVRQTT